MNRVAVEKWLRRLVKHFCKKRTMCFLIDYEEEICPLFNYCTDRTKQKKAE